MENNKNNHFIFLEAYAKKSKDGIQVANAEGKLVYVNEKAKKRLGINKPEDVYVWEFEPYFKGLKDWKEHVDYVKNMGEITIRSTHTNLLNKKTTPVEVTVTHQIINGENYLFAVSKDISNIVKQEKALNIRETMLLAISESTAELLNNNDFYDATSKVLAIIGKAVKVDRTYLFTVDESNPELVSQRSEWNSGDADPQIENPELQGVPLGLFDDFLMQMQRNIPFQSIVDQLKESPLKEVLQSQDIVSILIIPVFHKGQFWGFIGYDECKYERVWDKVELSILQTLSNNMSAALERIDYNKQIENLAEFPMENPAPIIRLDKEGRVVFQNKINQIENGSFILQGENKTMNLSELLQYIANDVVDRQKLGYYEVKTGKNDFYSITAKDVVKKSHINLYFSDITKLRKIERELRKTKTIVDQVVRNMEDVVWSVTYPDFKSLYISPSTMKLFGISAKEFYEDSKIWMENIIGEDKSIIAIIFEELQEKKFSNVEYRVNTDMGVKWVNNKIKAIYDEKGVVYRLDGLISDITKQKQINEELKHAKEEAVKSSLAKESFIANVSHEIRTPLNAILGLANVLKEDLSSEKSNEYINNIIYSSKHLRSLIENVLDMAKISEGKITLKSISFSMEELIKTVRSIFIPLAQEKGIELSIKSCPKVKAQFLGDYVRIKQVLINVLSNSLKFTEKGSVHLAIEVINETKKTQALSFIVSDTGIGMEKAFVKNIFNKFSRGKSAEHYTGAGLGMTISYELIKIMNGKISVQSKLGTGTKVQIELPLLIDKKLKENKEEQKDTSNNKPIKILHAEDNPINLLIVRSVLEKYNIILTEVENGAKAIEELKTNEFDCILLDIQMPLIDGFKVADIARKKLGIKAPIMGISANALTSQIDKSKKYGMNEYLTKPFEAETLVETINILLKKNNKTLSVKEKNIYYDSKVLEAKEYDSDFKEHMTSLFIDKTPENLRDLKRFLSQKDYLAVKRLVHKIKPSFEIFGIKNIKEPTKYIMSLDKENNVEWEKLNKCVDSLVETLELTIIQMKKDLSSTKEK